MNVYDVIIIGAGPGGLTAAIYALRSGLKTLVLEDPSILSQTGYAASVENFPGFPQGIKGIEIIQKLKEQAVSFSAEFISTHVKALEPAGSGKSLIWDVVSDDKRRRAVSVITASGASAKRLNIPGEARLSGKGVSYCAVCDGFFFKNRKVAVIGGGNSAVEEALYLADIADKVYLIHRRDALRAVKVLQERALSSAKIEIVWDSVAEEISGENKVNSIQVKNVKDESAASLECEGVFISIGNSPNTDFIKGVVDTDKNGYIITKDNLETSKKGIFAAGDCRDTGLRQIVTACADGAIAGVNSKEYVDSVKKGHK